VTVEAQYSSCCWIRNGYSFPRATDFFEGRFHHLGRRGGFTRHLVKPISYEELLNALREVVTEQQAKIG